MHEHWSGEHVSSVEHPFPGPTEPAGPHIILHEVGVGEVVGVVASVGVGVTDGQFGSVFLHGPAAPASHETVPAQPSIVMHATGGMPLSTLPSQSSSTLLQTSATGALFALHTIAPLLQLVVPAAHAPS